MYFIRVLQIIFISFLLPLSLTTTTLHGGPVGISLCKYKCMFTIGCEIYNYLPDHLTCLEGTLSTTPKSKLVSKRLKRPTKKEQMNCQTGSRVLTTRNHRQICREVEHTSALRAETAAVLSTNQLNILRKRGYCEKRKGKRIYMYKIYSETRSWDNAMKQCIKDGGLLAQLDKDFKWEMAPTPKPGTHDQIWIGLRDQQKNDKYVWLDGTEFKDEKRWSRDFLASEPNHRSYGVEQNCASIFYKTSLQKYDMYDGQCSRESMFLCEIVREEK